MAKRPVIRDTWKDYLSFSRRERRGIFALLSIILLQVLTLLYLNYFPSKESPSDFSEFEKEVTAFYASLDAVNDTTEKRRKNDFKNGNEPAKNEMKKDPELFAFNPNKLPEKDWQRLGFSEKQIRVIKNYEAKGGKFYTKENLKKMYCISDEQYSRIEPYVDIPVMAHEKKESSFKKYERPAIMVDIGTADSTELLLLRGVGPSFARRISAYRNKLGGFLKLEQLKEVWGVSDSLYQVLLPEISLKDTSNIRKINLNTAEFNELKNHPYIGYQVANFVTNYRKQHNGFKSPEEIKKIPLVNEQLYSKLAPYLTIE